MANKRFWTHIFTMVLVVFVSTCTWAKAALQPEDAGMNYSLNMGTVFIPSDNTASDSEFIVGVSWQAPTQEFVGKGSIGFSIDWTRLEKLNGDEVNLFPILISYRQYSKLFGRRIYFDLGVGITYASDNISEMKLDNGANVAWVGGAGIDFTREWFGTARYIASKNPSDDGLLVLQIGRRF